MTDLPRGWAQTTIGEVADVGLGRQRSPKNHTGEHMRPYLRSANVTWGGIDTTDVKEMNFDPDEAKKFELQPGDLLLNEASGSPNEVGKPAIWNGEIPGACFQNTLLRVHSRGPHMKYLYWYCYRSALLGEFGEAGRGVNIRHLGKRGLADFPLPLPPLAEQERIVAAIEEHFSHLDAAETSLFRAQRNLDRLRSSALASMFSSGWKRSPLVELAAADRPICYGILKPKTDRPGVVPYVEVRSIRDGEIDVESLHRTTQELHDEFRRSELREGDVVFAVRGSWDRAAVVPAELAGANVSRDVARVSPNPTKLRSQFLRLFLHSPEAMRFFATHARGVAVKGVNIGDLRQLPTPAPSLADQDAVVAQAQSEEERARRVAAEISIANRRSGQLRRAILAAAFSGQLVPQDSTDEPASMLLDRIRVEASTRKSTRKKKSA